MPLIVCRDALIRSNSIEFNFNYCVVALDGAAIAGAAALARRRRRGSRCSPPRRCTKGRRGVPGKGVLQSPMQLLPRGGGEGRNPADSKDNFLLPGRGDEGEVRHRIFLNWSWRHWRCGTASTVSIADAVVAAGRRQGAQGRNHVNSGEEMAPMKTGTNNREENPPRSRPYRSWWPWC